MSTITKTHKPQAAIDSGLLTKSEAAAYLGMSTQAFSMISGRIPSIRLGTSKYYDTKDLLAYLANRQRISRKSLQPIEN